MGSYESNIDILESIFDLDDKAVMIARDVKDNPVIGENIGGTVILFHIIRRGPVRFAHVIVPTFQGLFCLRMPYPVVT
jgi:hypothetical protein